MSAVPPHRAEAGSERSVARSGRRSLAAALLLGAVGAAVVLLASRQGWAEGTAAVPGGRVSLTAKGGDVTGVPAALAIVGLAALVAVFAVRRVGRLVVSALLALSGAGALAAAVLGAGRGRAGSVLDEKAAEVSGDSAAHVTALSHTAWPYVAAGGGGLILLAGLLALRCGRLWPAMSGRYERGRVPRPRPGDTGTTAQPPDERPEELWKALDRGEDPTSTR